jgi:hypothetical protein
VLINEAISGLSGGYNLPALTTHQHGDADDSGHPELSSRVARPVSFTSVFGVG